MAGRAGADSNFATGGGAGARAGVGIAGRAVNAGALGGGAGGGTGGRTGAAGTPPIGFIGGGASGGRACVVRWTGVSGARVAPGTGGVKRGIIGGRATGAAAAGAAGGTAGGVTWGGTGGVTGRAGAGVGGRTGAAAATGVDGRTGAAAATGVDGRAGIGGASVIAGISPVGRLARATTPGVKTGVGFLRCGGAEKGVANGIERRGVAGVGTFGTSTERRCGGSKASGAASASDSITARSFAAQAEPIAGTAAEARAGVGVAAPSIPTRITAPQTEQRARTPPGGTFEGSTRKTD